MALANMTNMLRGTPRIIKEHDWVGLRALYLLMASDASAVCSPEVTRIKNYYTDKYGHSFILEAMNLLSRDNSIRGTFEAPDVAFARRMYKAIQIRGEGHADFVEDIAKDTEHDPR